MTDLAQPWPPGTEPGYLGNTEAGTVKPAGLECARVWHPLPPGADYHVPPPAWPSDVPVPPTAVFSYRPPSPSGGDLVVFDGSASQPGSSPIAGYAWQFADLDTGDQDTASGVTATWQLPPGHGTYTATLTVTDTGNLTDTATQVITA